MATDVKHFSKYSLDIFISSVENCLFNVLATCRLTYSSQCLIWEEFYCIVDKIFLHHHPFPAILFTLLIVFIADQKLLISCNPICLFLGLFLVQLEVFIESLCLCLHVEMCFLFFSSSSSLILLSSIHFKSVSMQNERYVKGLIFPIQVSNMFGTI